MQLTDAEIREILRRRKIEKKRRQRRRRRQTLLIVIILFILAFVFIKVVGKHTDGKNSSEDSANSGAAGDRGIIFIDPGHGGSDPGSDDGQDRIEKDDTLRLSLSIRDQLEALGFTVVMSRTEDKDVDRTKRGELANQSGAQLFVSIHRNQADGGGQGIEGFIPRINDSQSRLLGENIMHALGRVGFTERTIRAGTLNDPNEDYEELAETTMPSALMEIGFLSSSADNELFDKNFDKNAKAIADAIAYTFMIMFEPENAAEYAAKIAAVDQTTEKVIDDTKHVVEVTAELIHIEPEEEPEQGQGIDPEA